MTSKQAVCQVVTLCLPGGPVVSRGGPPREAWSLRDNIGALNARHVRELRCHVRGFRRLGSGCQGEGHFYVEAACGPGVGGEGGAVGVGDGADDGEAQPVSFAAPGSLGAELPEWLEQVLHRVRLDKCAGVADRAASGSVLYLALIALLSLGAATALREAAAAIGAVLGLLYVLPIVAVFTGNATLSRHLQQVAPMTAGLAIQATTRLNTLPLSPWAGLGVLTAWAVGALVLGGLMLRSRPSGQAQASSTGQSSRSCS